MYIAHVLSKECCLVVERAVMELAEALMFIGVLRWDFVRESEEEESERLSQNKVEAGCLDPVHVRLGLGGALEGISDCLHLSELMYDRRVKFMFVGETPLGVAMGGEHFWTEGTAMVSRESTEELMECGVSEVAVAAVEEGKVAMVHTRCMG
jgi:hypothetical protein